MLSWIVDNAFTLCLMLALAATTLGILWYRSRRRELLWSVCAAGSLIIAVWLLSRFVVTDRQLLAGAVHDIAAAFARGDGEGVARHLATDFQHYDLTRDSVRQKVKQVVNQFGIVDVGAWNFEFPEIDRGRKIAQVEFYIQVTSETHETTRPYLIRAEFVLDGGAWKLRRFQRYNPFANSDQEIPYPQP